MPHPEDSLASARRTIETEIQQLQHLRDSLGADFAQAIDLIAHTSGKVVLSGMGKSGIIARKIAATLASTGTSAFFMHPAEGLHGDLGMITRDDILIGISNSGTTGEVLQVAAAVKRLSIPVIAISNAPGSPLNDIADVGLGLAVDREACPNNLAPTSSTTNTLVLGDCLAIALLERKNFSPEQFAFFHPSGALGKRLLTRVGDLMASGDELPLAHRQTSFADLIYEISQKGFGAVGICEDSGELCGILTDGDLRRLMQTHGPELFSTCAEDIMHPDPRRIAPERLATEALAIMERHRITSLFCTDDQGRPQGFIHLHRLLREGIA